VAKWKAFTVDVADHVAQVTLTGPGKGNSMGADFWIELPEVFAGLDADSEIRAVILAGSGDNFSYGLDFQAIGPVLGGIMKDRPSAADRMEVHDYVLQAQAAVAAVANCCKPVIAVIHGWCIGGGLDLVAATDIRYASADAKFSLREVKMAIVADVGSLQRLPGIIGDGYLRELAFTGKDIDAARAEKIGLVNDVFPDSAATFAAAATLAAEIAANAPLAVRGIKQVLNHQRASQVADGLRYVAAWNSAFLGSEDLTEVLQAKLERRPAKFRGR
jgi:enoyl-CoA hydratase